LLESQQGELSREQLKTLAARAFEVVGGYDLATFGIFQSGETGRGIDE
jgi:hypothetical protein